LTWFWPIYDVMKTLKDSYLIISWISFLNSAWLSSKTTIINRTKIINFPLGHGFYIIHLWGLRALRCFRDDLRFVPNLPDFNIWRLWRLRAFRCFRDDLIIIRAILFTHYDLHSYNKTIFTYVFFLYPPLAKETHDLVSLIAYLHDSRLEKFIMKDSIP